MDMGGEWGGHVWVCGGGRWDVGSGWVWGPLGMGSSLSGVTVSVGLGFCPSGINPIWDWGPLGMGSHPPWGRGPILVGPIPYGGSHLSGVMASVGVGFCPL